MTTAMDAARSCRPFVNSMAGQDCSWQTKPKLSWDSNDVTSTDGWAATTVLQVIREPPASVSPPKLEP